MTRPYLIVKKVMGSMPTRVVQARIGDKMNSTMITWMMKIPDLRAIEIFVVKTSWTTLVSALSLERRSPVRFFSKNSTSFYMIEV